MRQTITVVANAITEDIRRETFEGVGHVVLPAVLVQEQVLRNNLGASYLPRDEIAKSVDAWNDMPVVIRHPQRNGQPVSARTPEIADNYRVGRIYNARMDDGKLKAEIWLSEPRLEAVNDAETITMNIERGVVSEISTGFTTNAVEIAGEFRGDRYDVVMTKVQPDHLALLVDEPGACSVADGCGLGVNKMEAIELTETFVDRVWNALRGRIHGEHGAAASGEPVDNDHAADTGDTNMDRKDMIAALVDSGVELSEEAINAMTDCDLKALHARITHEAEKPEPVEADKPTADAPDEQSTEIAELKAAIQQLTEAVKPVTQDYAQQKAQLVDALADRVAFSKDRLATMSREDLEALAKTVNVNYAIQGAPRAKPEPTPAYKAPKMYWDAATEVN